MISGSFRIKKIKKIERVQLILNILSNALHGVTVGEVYQILTEKHHIDVPLKTIERDILEILKSGIFILDTKSPHSISPTGMRECIMRLTNEEITYLLVVLLPNHPLNLKLRAYVGIENYEIS